MPPAPSGAPRSLSHLSLCPEQGGDPDPAHSRREGGEEDPLGLTLSSPVPDSWPNLTFKGQPHTRAHGLCLQEARLAWSPGGLRAMGPMPSAAKQGASWCIRGAA